MLNDNIKALRMAKGLSQEELASRIHVVRQTISKWEKGISVPDAEALQQLAGALETTVPTLLGETLPEPETPAETIDSLAEKLAQLNDLYSREQAHRHSVKRTVCIITLVISLLILAGFIVAAIYGFLASREIAAAVGVIGGADGPTSVFVTRWNWQLLNPALALIVSIVCIIILYRMRRNRNT